MLEVFLHIHTAGFVEGVRVMCARAVVELSIWTEISTRVCGIDSFGCCFRMYMVCF